MLMDVRQKMIDVEQNYDGRQQTTNGNERWLRRMATTTNNDYDGSQRWRHCRTIHVRELCNNGVLKKRKKFFSSTLCFLFILNSLLYFFNESCSLFLWSFVQRANRDGNREMIFEKWRKPSVYRSRVPLTNLHEELE
jgi:hypothetical protein